MATILRKFSADFKNLNDIRDLVGNSAREWGLDETQIYELQLATDEAASNIIEHGYEGEGENTIELRVAKEYGGITVTLIDSGPPYQPNFIKIPGKSRKVTDMEVGGLGLYFIHKLMDEVTYQYDPKIGNILNLRKRIGTVQKPKKRNRDQVVNEIFDLGRQLIDAPTMDKRKELVENTLEELFGDGADLWLNERAFRLPGQMERLFADDPESELQSNAIKRKKPARSRVGEEDRIAIPILKDDLVQGAVEVWRSGIGRFTLGEEKALDGVAKTISIAYSAWHQLEIERWRLRQLKVLEQVSAELIREPDINRMCEKASKLILTGFKVYGVGIFTFDKTGKELLCRAAIGGATRESGSVRSFSYRAEWGKDPAGLAVQSGELTEITDISASELKVEELPEARSRIAIPLKTEDQVIGALEIHSENVDGFHHVDIMVLKSLADTIALAIEGSILLEEQQAQAARMRLIMEAGHQITSILDLNELMNEVGKLVNEKLGFPFVHLFSVHHNRRQIRYEGGAGERSSVLEGYVIDLDDPNGFIPWSARSGETIISGDVKSDPRYIESPLPPYNTVSEITVPLLFNGIVNGVLDIQSDLADAFSEQDRITLETLGDNIASAIRNAELYHSEQWRRQSVDSLREVAGLLSKNVRVEQVLNSILTELERNLPADISAVWLVEDGDLICSAAHGADPKALEQIKDESEDAFNLLAKMVLNDSPTIRLADDPYGPSAILGGYKPDHSAIYVPLAIAKSPLGVLTLAHHTAGRYGHEAAAMTSTFASYASVSIENARLYDNAQQQAYASATLLQIAQAVVSLNYLDEIFETITRSLPILVGVDKVAIFTWVDSQKISLANQYGMEKESASHWEKPFVPEDLPILAQALNSGEVMISKDGYKGDHLWPEAEFSSDRGEGSTYSLDDRLLMAIPLILKNDILGVLLVEEAEGGKRFRDRRLEILIGVAQQITLAIQNENYQSEKIDRERLETEVNVARQIQKTFLPSNPSINAEWQIAAEWLTAKQMGGDLYDLIDLGEGRFGVFIADVADKGIGAALFMASTRTLLRASTGLFNNPADMMAWLNQKLTPDCENGMFVTAFLAILDTKTGNLDYVNAGHNPPIVISGDQITRLTRTGIALGAMEDAQYSQNFTSITDGDVVCFYTDGITEAFSPVGEMFGEERLSLLLQQADPAMSAAEILEDILFAVREMTNHSALSDDISILIIKKSPVKAGSLKNSA